HALWFLNSASNPVKPNATVRWAADVQRNSDIMFAALGDRSWPVVRARSVNRKTLKDLNHNLAC
ncbi:hypothetical protein, partial [Paraburkholderia caffeinilytica]|uniref:hypothetical protein n=1 Tax=Paraburkholderia caffeinilytica TaxID=1761016 RepID=UPI001E2D3BB3